MPRTQDRRSRATRAALIEAFVDGLLTRGYAALTPAQLASAAGVARSTFYQHFAGKRALLSEVLHGPCGRLAMAVTDTVDSTALAALLAHFRAQRRLNDVFFHSPVRDLWVRALAEEIALLLRRAPVRGPPTLPPLLRAAAIAEAQVGLIGAWLDRWPRLPERAVADALSAMSQALARR